MFTIVKYLDTFAARCATFDEQFDTVVQKGNHKSYI